MRVRLVDPGETIRASREEVVVCLPVYNGYEHFVGCLRSVLLHTPANIPLLVCDDASTDPRPLELVLKLAAAEGEHEILYLKRDHNLGFAANVNGAFAMAAPADVVILNSDCVVGEGWLEGLREAAYSDSRIASATALSNHGSIASVPERRPAKLPQDWSFDDAAAVIRARSLRIRPRLPTAIGHCVYFRRSALDLVGDFDLAFSPGYGEEVDLSQRCIRFGLCHVLADEVFVLHHGGGSFTPDGNPHPVKEPHERLLATRYPYYHRRLIELAEDPTSPLARSLSVARRALCGTSVVIDARSLAGPMTGTQLQVLEVITALARTGRVRITAVVPDRLGDYAAAALRPGPQLELVTKAEAAAGRIRADVVHRPYQVNNLADLRFLTQLGERLIVTNQDLIAYHNPSYFADADAWSSYRRTTQVALAVSDHVVFVSAHARDDALAEDLLDGGRASVVHNGIDHALAPLSGHAVPPRGAEHIPPHAETILCIGTDFRHKNRLFALRVLQQLQRQHGWNGYLLLAGPAVDHGSSRPEEAEHLTLHPRVGDSLIDVAGVSESEKVWMYDRADLVLYPTVHEGFGLIPFEAANHAVPCLWAPGTSLREVLPAEPAGIVEWDAEACADRAVELLRDSEARERNVAAIISAGKAMTWDASAASLLEIYSSTCDRPASRTSAPDLRHGAYQDVVSEDALRLFGPSGALPRDVERPLLALATHPQVGAPVFSALKFGYQASYWLRRRRRNGGTRFSA